MRILLGIYGLIFMAICVGCGLYDFLNLIDEVKKNDRKCL